MARPSWRDRRAARKAESELQQVEQPAAEPVEPEPVAPDPVQPEPAGPEPAEPAPARPAPWSLGSALRGMF
ncbi:MAG: hypothetical protein ABUL47_03810 [Leifsonia sp.]